MRPDGQRGLPVGEGFPHRREHVLLGHVLVGSGAEGRWSPAPLLLGSLELFRRGHHRLRPRRGRRHRGPARQRVHAALRAAEQAAAHASACQGNERVRLAPFDDHLHQGQYHGTALVHRTHVRRPDADCACHEHHPGELPARRESAVGGSPRDLHVFRELQQGHADHVRDHSRELDSVRPRTDREGFRVVRDILPLPQVHHRLRRDHGHHRRVSQ
mmetsp:Transcript_111988/g.348989  ORF Transcript_111988/g.348989 Transcript_111988/m.348989 type:complete len:215 (+) Transcript_111988:575-1219(+)